MNKKIILFENALQNASSIAKKHLDFFPEITIVRDIQGRIRFLLPGTAEKLSATQQEKLKLLQKELSSGLGNYGSYSKQTILFAEELYIEQKDIKKERYPLFHDMTGTVFLLERQITGNDWHKKALSWKKPGKRVTFFGIKGGVGRSTALAIWAWHLAKSGKRVLIFDLDLESPGIGSTILPPENRPDFGVLDWFMEDLADQAKSIENEMCGNSPLAENQPGTIDVIPAFGAKTTDFMARLSRCYMAKPGKNPLSWAERLHTMICSFEDRLKPDLVILDSRAGLHDISAVTISRLQAQSFLFAIDSQQTWEAYKLLFKHWQKFPEIACQVREKLHIVAAMIPETGRENYLKSFLHNSWDLFLNLYDDESEHNKTTTETFESFNFDLTDELGPHYPLPIFWQRAMQEFKPLDSANELNEKTLTETMGSFVKKADELIWDSPDMEQ